MAVPGQLGESFARSVASTSRPNAGRGVVIEIIAAPVVVEHLLLHLRDNPAVPIPFALARPRLNSSAVPEVAEFAIYTIQASNICAYEGARLTSSEFMIGGPGRDHNILGVFDCAWQGNLKLTPGISGTKVGQWMDIRSVHHATTILRPVARVGNSSVAYMPQIDAVLAASSRMLRIARGA